MKFHNRAVEKYNIPKCPNWEMMPVMVYGWFLVVALVFVTRVTDTQFSHSNRFLVSIPPPESLRMSWCAIPWMDDPSMQACSQLRCLWPPTSPLWCPTTCLRPAGLSAFELHSHISTDSNKDGSPTPHVPPPHTRGTVPGFRRAILMKFRVCQNCVWCWEQLGWVGVGIGQGFG